MNINWALAGQIAVLWIAAGFVASPFIGRWLRKRREQRDRAARTARLAQMCVLAEEYDSASTASERSRIYRKAQSLGFTEEDEPFHLDDVNQPHLPRAS